MIRFSVPKSGVRVEGVSNGTIDTRVPISLFW